MKLPEKVSTIVVGNPLIADVAVQSGGLVVVTGKGYGTTNLIVLDRAGARADGALDRGARREPEHRRGLSRHGARDLQLHAALRAPHHARRFRRLFLGGARPDRHPQQPVERRRQPRANSAGADACASRKPTCCSRSWLAKREARRRFRLAIQATIRQRDFAKDKPDQAYRLTAVQRASPIDPGQWRHDPGNPGRPCGRNKAALSRIKLLRIRTVRRFARGEDGIAAVEFGIVAAPFLALMFAIMETAIVFFASQTLETAVADSARLIMTGPGAAASFTQAQFKTAVCAKILGLFDCANGIKIDVKTYSSFSSVTHRQADRRERQSVDQFRLHAGRAGRHRGGAADVRVADLRVAARLQSRRHGGRKAPDHRDRGVPQRALPMRGAMSLPSALARAGAPADPRACCATSAASRRSSSRCCCR